jgi:FMN phosphatase YigB (HAD superfamily)
LLGVADFFNRFYACILMPVRVVSFDMEGTLVDHSFSNQIWEIDIPQLYAEAHGLDLVKAHDQVISQYMEIGEGRVEWYDVGYWWRRLELPGDWRTLITQRRNTCNVYRDVPEAFALLGNRRPLIVSSNTLRDFLEIQLECVGVPFIRTFSAPSDFGALKNSSAFYTRICDELQILPSELAHVGDHAEFDYRAPKKLGVKAFHLDRSGELNGPDVVHDLVEFVKRLGET